MPDRNATVLIRNLELYAETDKAILIGPPGLTTNQQSSFGRVWIPRSFLSFSELNAVSDIGDIELPRWVAEQNELEYEED